MPLILGLHLIQNRTVYEFSEDRETILELQYNLSYTKIE